MSKLIIKMSQTETDDVVNTVDEVMEETTPTTNTPTNTTKTPRKRKAPAKILSKVKLRKRNQMIHKKRVQRKEDAIKSQIRKDKNQKLDALKHKSKKCCLLSPKQTYEAIYNEISYPKTAILPNNEEEWNNLKDVEDMYDEYGLINYIIKLHKQMTSVYFMVRDLEYRYRGYYL